MIFMQAHPSAACECGTLVSYGTKDEVSGWKVYAECPPSEGCGRDFGRVGWVDVADIETMDEVNDAAVDIVATRVG